MSKYFVAEDSIVRRIWGKADTVLFIFAGSSAEFALNKAVDWLYFTGKLPADPIGRLFSTVTYARKIVFAEREHALAAIDQITAIHKNVESKRGASIPDWAYRDVLYMLIDYSIRSFEVLERQLSEKEKSEVFEVFNAVGLRMGISGLPQNYNDWIISRFQHLNKNLIFSTFTTDLYKQYHKHLGTPRFEILKQVQRLIVPMEVKALLPPGNFSFIRPLLSVYKLSEFLGMGNFIKRTILPKEYKTEFMRLEESIDNGQVTKDN